MRRVTKVIKIAKRVRDQAVEEIRGFAADEAEKARKEYYVQAVRFWRIAPGGERMLLYLRDAAELDGVQLEDER